MKEIKKEKKNKRKRYRKKKEQSSGSSLCTSFVVINKQQFPTPGECSPLSTSPSGDRDPPRSEIDSVPDSAKSPAPVSSRSPLPVPMMSEEFVMVIAHRRRRPRGGHAKCRIPTEHDCSLGEDSKIPMPRPCRRGAGVVKARPHLSQEAARSHIHPTYNISCDDA